MVVRCVKILQAISRQLERQLLIPIALLSVSGSDYKLQTQIDVLTVHFERPWRIRTMPFAKPDWDRSYKGTIMDFASFIHS